MNNHSNLSAQDALAKLKRGNEIYLTANTNVGDVSAEIRSKTHREGQTPYAVIITCADSRVIPESIFCAGIGELFVIRVAGNVVGDVELGSVEYALHHLHTRLIVVMGHTCCGAINATLQGGADGYAQNITDEIKLAIGCETNDERACVLNVIHTVNKIKSAFSSCPDVLVTGAIYRIDTGKVEFI